MKAIRLFSMAAVALMMCACSEDVIEQKEAPAAKGMPFKATISMGGATRTTMTEGTGSDAGKMLVEWKTGDEVAICYGDGTTGYKDVFTVTPVGDGTATISGTLSGTATQGQAVTVYYPAAMVTSVDNDGNVNGTSAAPYASQAGTLAGLGNCDARSATTTFHVDGSGATLSSNVKLTGSTIIWKLNLEYASAALVADQVSFSILDPTSGKWTTAETVSGISKSEVYLAIPNYGYSDAKILIEATKGSDKYFAIYSGVTLAANTYYQSTLDMFKLGSGTLHVLTSSTGDLTLNDGDVLTGTGGEDTHVTIAAGANVILDNVDITSIPNDDSHQWAGITCAGNAIVAVVGTNKVKGGHNNYPGIQAGPSSTTLMIAGEGSLEATSSGSCAGIGSGNKGTCGNITILQGIITATSENGAGIGSGGRGTCGNITIYGGTVTATGHSSGIGSGYSGTCGDINISDGTVTATYTGNLGSGIGSGDKGTCGAITISGGNITAAWVTNGLSHNGAGIGSGGVDDGSSTCGAITISGGTVKATGGTYAPGIGAGYAYSGTSTCGEITFSGGTVTAIAGTDAPTAIGKGYVSGTGTSSTGNILLDTNCDVTMVNSNVTDSDPDTQNFLDTGDGAKSVNIGSTMIVSSTVNYYDMMTLPSGFNASYDGSTKSWQVWYY